MPELSPSELVQQIHAAGGRAVVGITGGGSRAIAELLEVPGGSRTLLEALVPYSSAALVRFLGGRPEQFCSARTARAMAMAAFQRGQALQCDLDAPAQPATELVPVSMGNSVRPRTLAGIGCTASLVSDHPKRGAHRIHVAVHTASATFTDSLELEKGRRTRVEEESITSQMVLNALAASFGINARLPLPLLTGQRVESIRTLAPQAWQALQLGVTNVVAASTEFASTAQQPRAIFPGAFNPLHDGHRRMAEIAVKRLGVPVHFEISIENVAKLPLDYTEMQLRADQFAAHRLPLWFTRAPTFEEKAAIFPRATFIVGVDTLVRIGQACFYHNDPAAAEAAIRQIGDQNCRFLVFGRVMQNEFQTLDDLTLSPALRDLCEMISPDEFRVDISSTALRQLSTDPHCDN